MNPIYGFHKCQIFCFIGYFIYSGHIKTHYITVLSIMECFNQGRELPAYSSFSNVQRRKYSLYFFTLTIIRGKHTVYFKKSSAKSLGGILYPNVYRNFFCKTDKDTQADFAISACVQLGNLLSLTIMAALPDLHES